MQDPMAIRMIECCGKGCAIRQNAEKAMLQLKESASNCKTLADYVAFLNDNLSMKATEVENGIVLHLGKEKCSCPIATEISINKEMLCECTAGHEKAMWSVFFGKPVGVEIVESFLRGGKDCVLKIIF